MGAAARDGRADQGRGAGEPRPTARAARAERDRRGWTRALGARRGRGVRADRQPDRGSRSERGDQDEVADDRRDRARSGAGAARDRRLGDRPGGDDHPARPRSALAHRRARDPPLARRDPRPVRAHVRSARPQRRPGAADGGGAAGAARAVHARPGRNHRRQLRRRGDRDDRARRVRRQRPYVHDAAAHADLDHGDRKGAAAPVGPSGDAAAAAALGGRSTDELVRDA